MSDSTLVLVPGLMCDATVWEHQSATLGALAEVRVAELGGLDSIERMAQAVLQQAPAERFALAGHSMGGRVAIEVVRQAPERVTALALLDTGYRPLAAGERGEREIATRQRLLELARTAGVRAMAKEWLVNMVHPERRSDRVLNERIIEMMARRTAEDFAAQIRALLGRPDAGKVLPTVRCRTLVLCGREDSWAPVEQHREIAALVPRSQLTVIPDCGHMSTMERPEAVSEALGAWLQASDQAFDKAG
ncbi:MAG: alpha/beta hydrolase [Proteobacteria bacterium]|nr:MAG: alpha/beta hydrolase [Pseudomonadota bacterium]